MVGLLAWPALVLSEPNFERDGIPVTLPQVQAHQAFILDFNYLLADHWTSVERLGAQAIPGLSINQLQLAFIPDAADSYDLNLKFQSQKNSDSGFERGYRWEAVNNLSDSRNLRWQKASERSSLEVTAQLEGFEDEKPRWWAYPVEAYEAEGERIEAISILIEKPTNHRDRDKYSWRFALSSDEGFSVNAPRLRNWSAEATTLDNKPVWKSYYPGQRSDQAFTVNLHLDSNYVREVGHYWQFIVHPSITYDDETAECYIATRVYGDVKAPEVEALREFRGEVLMQSATGRWLVRQYYQYSPAFAEWMDDKPRLQALVRWGLDRLISFWQWFSR
ncbi:hypothetical protein SAMN05660443_1364 [Marinospirillum celere]|uniref:Uncharacterized protein n=2 Tax=Marinospirillum celere TaxID=1122252 RepID=A0A1I1G1T8_9GAMM|nr:hypothetical protein SAMN05660443_1364 [Marinospirillum celere]